MPYFIPEIPLHVPQSRELANYLQGSHDHRPNCDLFIGGSPEGSYLGSPGTALPIRVIDPLGENSLQRNIYSLVVNKLHTFHIVLSNHQGRGIIELLVIDNAEVMPAQIRNTSAINKINRSWSSSISLPSIKYSSLKGYHKIVDPVEEGRPRIID